MSDDFDIFSNDTDCIIHRVYELYEVFYLINERMPKKDRYTLGIKLEKLILDLLETLFLAKSKFGASKMLLLNNADLKLKVIMLMIRLSSKVKAITDNKYLHLEGKALEIGRMLGGWIKSEYKTKGQ